MVDRMSEPESAVKPNSLDLPVQNGKPVEEIEPIILNGEGFGHYMTSPPPIRSPSSLSHRKNGFFVSFMVDARGGVHKGRRHSGVDVHIPKHRVCQPTRITCKLIKREKATSLPKLNDGENLASRVVETGPVRAIFTGPVQLDVPHFASLRDGEREIVIMRSDDGLNWYQHNNNTPNPSPSDESEKRDEEEEEDEDDEEGGALRQITKVYTSDFPRYFVAVTRLSLDSSLVGPKGSTLKSSVIPQVQAVFAQRSVNKETKIGVQVLPVQNDVIQRCLGRIIPVSPVVTVEPRRRRFHEPITLTIPIPRGATLPTPKTKPAAQSLKILYSISGSSTAPKWEDITGSASLNIVNQTLSFATTLSARFWLLDCINVADPVGMAGEIYTESIVAPFLARFHVFLKRHTGTRAQVRVLCLTDEELQKTYEVIEGFTEIARSDVVEVLEGRPYYLNLDGGLSLTATPTVQPSLLFHSFHVNRLSFIVRCSAQQTSTGTLTFSKQRSSGAESSSGGGDAIRGMICSIPITLPAYDGEEEPISPEAEPEIYQQRFEAAVSSAAATKTSVDGGMTGGMPPVVAGVDGLRLAEVGRSLHGDWVPLSSQLGITQREVVKIQSEFGDVEEQAMIMLHLWVEKAGIRATSSQLEAALKRIGREDLLAVNMQPALQQTPNTAATPDSGDVNPIDSPLNTDDLARVLDFDTSERSMLFDAEPGAVYEMEQVWDGKEWHKTKRLSKAAEHPEDDSLQPADSHPVEAVAAAEQLTNHSTAAADDDESSIPEEQLEQQLINHSTTAVNESAAVSETPHDDVSLEQEHHGLEQTSLEVERDAGTGSDADERGSDIADSGETDRPVSLELNNGVSSTMRAPDILIEGEPMVDVDIQETEEVLPDGTVMRRKITTTQKVCPSLTVTTPDGSKILDESCFDGLTDDSAAQIFVTRNCVEGEPSVSTEVEETEEVTEDGTIVRKKLIKTQQQQSITTTVVVQGPEGSDLDQITDAIMQDDYENSNSSNTDEKTIKSQQ